jgi:Fungal specific transcription factor domain
MISIHFFDLNNSKPLLRRNLLLYLLPDGGKLRVSVTLLVSVDFIVAKSNAKTKEIRRRSNQSISLLSENSQPTPKSNLSASPDLSSNRSSYCAPPEEWGDTETISPRFLVLEGADENDIEDYFNFSLSIREPIAEGQTVDDMDLPYFGHFLSRMPQLMSFVDLFPSVVGDVFARSLEHAALRHSILTISTLLTTGGQTLDILPSRHYYHKQKALQLLQMSLGGSPKDLTENDAIAIFLLLWLDVNSGSSMSATHHLRGLYQVLQQVQNNTRESTGGFGGVSALLMLVWRSAYR